MLMEWLFIGVFVLGALLLIGRTSRNAGLHLLFAAIGALLVAGSIGWAHYVQKTELMRKEFRQRLPRQERPEYVSSANCRSCHPSQYASWHRSYHRTMTQVASPETVRGNFTNVVLRFDGDEYRFERRGDQFWVELVDPDWRLVMALKKRDFELGKLKTPPIEPEHRPKVWKQIDMLTGSHHMQAYWVPGDFGNQQFSFPFTYLFEDQRWVPRDEVFLKADDAPRLMQVWNGHCIRCHATAGRPLQDHRSNIFSTEVAELGIACEACHGPAYQHVKKNRDPIRRYALHQKSKGDPTIVNPARLDSKRSSEICGSCHGVKFVRDEADWNDNGFHFRPGMILSNDAPILIRLGCIAGDSRFPQEVRENPELLHGTFWPDGMIRVSGREYNGLVETPCYQKGDLSCMSCHSMHKSDPNMQVAAGMAGNQACLQCHEKFRANLAAHTHHKEGSNGSLCYNCHMPYTTYGLLKGLRSHQISSPSVAVNVKTGRPNGCNLCHLDKSLGWASTQLAKMYGQPEVRLSNEDATVSLAAKLALRGDAGQRALIAWHMGWKPAVETSGRDWMGHYLGQLLTDPYSAVRYISQRSLKRIPGFEALQYDYLAPEEARHRVQETVFSKLEQTPGRRQAAEPVLIGAEGRWQTNRAATLISLRDDRMVELLE